MPDDRPRLDRSRFEIVPLTAEDEFAGFCCGDGDLDDFVREDALRLQSQNTTRVYLGRFEGVLVAYVAVLTDALEMRRSSDRKRLGLAYNDPKFVPAVKVGRLATSAAFKAKYRGAGELLMRHVAALALEVAESVGCRLLTVDAYEESVAFYGALGFVPNHTPVVGVASTVATAGNQPTVADDPVRPTFPPRKTVSMRCDLYAEKEPRILSDEWD